MKSSSAVRRGLGCASWVLSAGCLLVACTPRVEAPAPVVSGGSAERGAEWVTVQRGDTLSNIAQAHHVPMRVIAEANGLSQPYRIQLGRKLMVPGGTIPGGQSRALAPGSVAASPTSSPQNPPVPPTGLDAGARVAAIERPSVTTAPLPPPVSASPSAEAIPPGTAEPARAAPAPASPPPQETRDRPASTSATASGAHTGGVFLWPVRGRILAGYGSGSDGTHNDGINIAAPRGAAVQAADAGIVAYTGNELHGYGNLVLIKHPNGWISAYAHCDQLLVKRGDKVARGQVIARVGSTGNVSEPQLHFELRHGHEAVDPREVLAPLPTAATKDSRPG